METDVARRVGDLLHEAAETHHRVYRIVDGADDDWASWYADWLIDLSELPDVLGRKRSAVNSSGCSWAWTRSTAPAGRTSPGRSTTRPGSSITSDADRAGVLPRGDHGLFNGGASDRATQAPRNPEER